MNLFKTGSRTGVEDLQIKFPLSIGTNSVDDFNAKVKLAVLRQMKNWELTQTNNLKLEIPDTKSNNFLSCLSHSGTILKKLHVPLHEKQHFRQQQCKTKRHSNHRDISPNLNSRLRLLDLISRID